MSTTLARADWQARAAAHATRMDTATAGHRERRAEGRAHPVEDFLFRYYRHSPAKLRRWHPGVGVLLAGAAGTERAHWRHHRTVRDCVEVDLGSFLAARVETVHFVRGLLEATGARPAHFGCFGLHEWAMVHRVPEGDRRHAGWPLRLGGPGTDAVVERHTIRCTHVDAHRFFSESAVARNTVTPTRATQVSMEQPGCLHAGMDLYKWAFSLTPMVPSDLTADAFELARDIRVLDMQASPYDLRELGYEPVRIETAEGKAQYVERQRSFSVRSQTLRRRLLSVLAEVEERSGPAGPR